MEACTVSLGDLIENRFTEKKGPLDAKNINTMGYDVSKALNYLHNEALLLHGDIKSFNILIKDDFAVCKLCDFGVSIPLKADGLIDFEKKPSATYTGTDLWNAPEVFEEDPEFISTKTDIFSFGLVLYECIALCPPHMLVHLDHMQEEADLLDDFARRFLELSSEKGFMDELSDKELVVSGLVSLSRKEAENIINWLKKNLG